MSFRVVYLYLQLVANRTQFLYQIFYLFYDVVAARIQFFGLSQQRLSPHKDQRRSLIDVLTHRADGVSELQGNPILLFDAVLLIVQNYSDVLPQLLISRSRKERSNGRILLPQSVWVWWHIRLTVFIGAPFLDLNNTQNALVSLRPIQGPFNFLDIITICALYFLNVLQFTRLG